MYCPHVVTSCSGATQGLTDVSVSPSEHETLLPLLLSWHLYVSDVSACVPRVPSVQNEEMLCLLQALVLLVLLLPAS